ncbi:hypothetical protein [Belnapia moabensis]|uniref:hypothetical protein n=1 Tax=Belnapia moabensis TaxID=365533 RepID=UPI0005B7B2FC|nr:hypothetical protein [Belnapia moabensis]
MGSRAAKTPAQPAGAVRRVETSRPPPLRLGRRALDRRLIPLVRAVQAHLAAGRNSLNVLCLDLFFSYAAASLFRAFPSAVPWLDLPLVGGGALLVMAIVWMAERRRQQAAAAAL